MKPLTDVLVLLSGGQDSTTCLAWARRQYPDARLHALTMLYGQRHATEVTSAKAIAKLLGCATHTVLDLSAVFAASGSALLSKTPGPLLADGGIVDVAAPQGLPTSFVPGRNLVFLSVAGAHAAALGAGVIVTGVCQTDYSGYPDCRDFFVIAMGLAINEAMPTALRPLRIEAPLMNLTKADSVELMVDLAKGEAHRGGRAATPTEWQQTDVWRALGASVTCYRGSRPGCTTCPACLLRAKGFDEAGVADPALRKPPTTEETLNRQAPVMEALAAMEFDPSIDRAIAERFAAIEFDATEVNQRPIGYQEADERDVVHNTVPMLRRGGP